MFYNTYKNMVDDWTIYYNSNEIFEEIADNNTIFDTERFNEFRKDLDANDK